MASTSAASRPSGVAGRIQSAATTLFSDNQSLIAEIRKVMITMKDVAVDLEGRNQSQMVKELEDGVLQLLVATEDCSHFSSAIQSVGNGYQPATELTDFKKLLDDEIAKSKANSSSVLQNHLLLRQFREAIWNVHHAGQPMPGEEQEDLVMTSTQSNLLNINCPLTGKPITELATPVRSVDCKHIYEKDAIMPYIKFKNPHSQCPAAGCPKILVAERVVCDPLLLVEIDEMRCKQSARTDVVEDFTNEEDSGRR
ncbi:E3 SUMO-protein like [Actinidia chinensis var. chinensis]|uniref:E3 SUMO-protein like n=1 Tax=Actinidia chinensis var. chinensis TaxID=1590841 RepID=A0A2R6QCI7_ACTCC|nr:E3 SUMO-protein like [Actinidia chinensis var. chinensis]